MIAIPIPIDTTLAIPVSNFDLQAVLDGVTYTLSFLWNARLGKWFVRVLDATGDNILVGDTCVRADYPLMVNSAAVPFPGCLVARDTTGQGQDPDLTTLGAAVQLWYFEGADIATAKLYGPLGVSVFVGGCLGY